MWALAQGLVVVLLHIVQAQLENLHPVAEDLAFILKVTGCLPQPLHRSFGFPCLTVVEDEALAVHKARGRKDRDSWSWLRRSKVKILQRV